MRRNSYASSWTPFIWYRRYQTGASFADLDMAQMVDVDLWDLLVHHAYCVRVPTIRLVAHRATPRSITAMSSLLAGM
ncbi:hypothetical protein HBI23_053250 [Parastagonospora nodorum]|nr:hypothetical protein HBI79_077010 [Parastagonospora nodorum]KAH5308412.1 hypothetical protein HBI12_158110 [Parastagonospora nodorum]KAH5431967.1 hypothetical protein HBI47_099660 [Parastagonospora nodorum]KAH5678310.1 hypothetical protein HBI23_053250 [Parastagonospora nodorum]KAH6063544.1 hypothetical protein HBI67_141310 [Parastagonospora nodorum]